MVVILKLEEPEFIRVYVQTVIIKFKPSIAWVVAVDGADCWRDKGPNSQVRVPRPNGRHYVDMMDVGSKVHNKLILLWIQDLNELVGEVRPPETLQPFVKVVAREHVSQRAEASGTKLCHSRLKPGEHVVCAIYHVDLVRVKWIHAVQADYS